MFDVAWDDEDGYLAFQYVGNMVFAHSELKHWNKTVYVKAQLVWECAKKELAEKGYKDIFVSIPLGDKKLVKFEKMFGFLPIAEKDGLLLMGQSLKEE